MYDVVYMFRTILYHTSTYNHLPEDESSDSKHIEDITN